NTHWITMLVTDRNHDLRRDSHRLPIPPIHFLTPRRKPAARPIAFNRQDGSRRTRGRTRRLATAQIALARFIIPRHREDRAEVAGDGAEMAADARLIQHDFHARDRLDAAGVDTASLQTPR